MSKKFEDWWEEHGRFCRAEGGGYEKSFAYAAWVAALNVALKTRSPSPRLLTAVGTGAFLDDQQYCFEKGWKEGAAALRKAIRDKEKIK